MLLCCSGTYMYESAVKHENQMGVLYIQMSITRKTWVCCKHHLFQRMIYIGVWYAVNHKDTDGCLVY